MGPSWVHTCVGVLATMVACGSFLLAATPNVPSEIQSDEFRRPAHRISRSMVSKELTVTDDAVTAASNSDDDDNTIPPKPAISINTSNRRWKTSGGGGNVGPRKLSVGSYSRTFSEKRHQVNRTKLHEKHTNHSIQTETKLTFHRLTPGQYYGPFGMHKLTVRNSTQIHPNGQGKSAEFSNITYFDGIHEDRGDDNIHPLTHYNRKLFMKEAVPVDGGI